MPRRQRLWEIVTVIGFCAFLYFFALGAFGLVGADEPRYAQVAREMFEREDLVTPTLHGTAWLEKPVLYYWRAMFAYALFGVHDWSARLPGATFGALLVVFVYFFMRKFRPGTEMEAALITASSVAMIGFARGASTDSQLAIPFSIAMLAWWAWHVTERKLWLAAFYAFIGLGVLAKGPIAVVLAGIIVLAFSAAVRDWKPALRTLWLPGIVLFLAVVVPWYAAVQARNPEFFRVFFLEHNLQRMTTDVFRHSQPLWYFVPVALIGLLPWTVLVMAAMADVFRRWRFRAAAVGSAESAFAVFLLIWGLAPIVFFSFSGSKLPGYILPGIPAFTLLAAEYAQRRREQGSVIGLGLAAGHAFLAAMLLSVAVLAPHALLNPKAPPPRVLLFVAAMAAGLAFAGITITLRQRGWAMLRFVTLVPVVVGLGYLLRVGAPAIDATQSARPIAQEIARIELQEFQVAVYKASRHIEYGLAFYRDEPILRYERNEVPPEDHLVVAAAGSRAELEKLLPGRRLSHVGGFPLRKVEYFWVSTPAEHSEHQH
jgi:4-amino-4-deoxy-L-arabinose transferase-like glycosyltransferase